MKFAYEKRYKKAASLIKNGELRKRMSPEVKRIRICLPQAIWKAMELNGGSTEFINDILDHRLAEIFTEMIDRYSRGVDQNVTLN